MKDLYENNEHLVPLIWQADGPNASPHCYERAVFYSFYGFWWCQFGGYISADFIDEFQVIYNQLVEIESPLNIDMLLDVNEQDEFVVNATIEVTDEITTSNNKVLYILTYHIDDDYFCSVVSYDEEDFGLTSIGEIGIFEKTIPIDPEWNLEDITAVVIVQTWDDNPGINQHLILQSAQTVITELLPFFTSNVQVGPACLGVQFNSNSFPIGEIISWEWDFDGDGVFDSTDENPYYLYETIGSYDVTLRISDGDNTVQTTQEDFINVTDGTNIYGNVSGIWKPEFNPYCITGDISILSDDELVIEPSVRITAYDNSHFTIYGKLHADAFDGEPIIFTSENEWDGITFQNTQQENIIRNCHISEATVCAIEVDSSKVDIIENIIFENTSSYLSSAINVNYSDEVLIHKNIIANNISSELSGGIGCTYSNIEISNNLIVNNTGLSAGAISLRSNSDANLINNTIANNLSQNSVIFIFNSSPIITNTIISDIGNVFYILLGSPTVSYSCITGGYEGIGNIDDDPEFVNPSIASGAEFDGLSASWDLPESSPCIDVGDNSPVYWEFDLQGNPRIYNGIVDIGAYEYIITNIEDHCVSAASALIGNYPNPFNPETTISFSNHKPGHIIIEVYNIKGQKVRTLVDKHLEASNHTVVWNGRNDSGKSVTSGVYFYKMKSGNYSSTKKMILMK